MVILKAQLNQGQHKNIIVKTKKRATLWGSTKLCSGSMAKNGETL